MGYVKTLKIYKCDNCGKEEAWSEKWRSKTILHKKGTRKFGEWEETITVCCLTCAGQLDEKEMRIKENNKRDLKKLHKEQLS